MRRLDVRELWWHGRRRNGGPGYGRHGEWCKFVQELLAGREGGKGPWEGSCRRGGEERKDVRQGLVA